MTPPRATEPVPRCWNTSDRGCAGLGGEPGPSRTTSSSKLSRIGLSADPCSRISVFTQPRCRKHAHARDGMGIADSALPQRSTLMSTFIFGVRSIPGLAVELREIEPLELVPVAVDDAHPADRLEKVSGGAAYSDSGVLTWYISTNITLSGEVRLTLWRSSLTMPAIVLITTSRLRLLWLRMVGRMANCGG